MLIEFYFEIQYLNFDWKNYNHTSSSNHKNINSRQKLSSSNTRRHCHCG